MPLNKETKQTNVYRTTTEIEIDIVGFDNRNKFQILKE